MEVRDEAGLEPAQGFEAFREDDEAVIGGVAVPGEIGAAEVAQEGAVAGEVGIADIFESGFEVEEGGDFSGFVG